MSQAALIKIKPAVSVNGPTLREPIEIARHGTKLNDPAVSSRWPNSTDGIGWRKRPRSFTSNNE
jgi:hypothetical protein